MSKKKIIIILVIMALAVALVRLGVVTFNSRMKSYKVMRKIETTMDKFRPKISTEEKQINEHMFYVSTPIGSVGIL